jgi:hypothetical protein
MKLLIYIILALILAAALFVISKIFYKKHVNQQAEKMVRRGFAIWARLGPFKCGADSAKAMEYASAAVMKNFEKSSPIDVKGHSMAFDKAPDRWEEVRQLALARDMSEFNELEQLVKAGKENLNQISRGAKINTPLPHFKTNKEWYEYLITLWPWELRDICTELQKEDAEDHALWYDVQFHVGAFRCFLEHGGFNQLIDDECHSWCLGMAECHMNIIRAMGEFPDIEKAYKVNLDHIKTYGWPSINFKLEENEITKLMRAKADKN